MIMTQKCELRKILLVTVTFVFQLFQPHFSDNETVVMPTLTQDVYVTVW